MSVPSFDVKGLNFAVTGGSKGLGWEVAQQLARRGSAFVLVIGGRSESPFGSESAQVAGCEMKYVKSDLLTNEGLVAICAVLREHFADKPLHGLANVAGLTFPRATMQETTPESWDKMMAVNCRAPVFLMREAASLMRNQGSQGSIVNVTSVAGYCGAPFIFSYSAAKAALNCATKTAAIELRPSNIRVNAVAMGWTLTDNENASQSAINPNWLAQADASHPFGRILRPVDLAATIGHLLSPAAVMITGTIVDVCPEYISGELLVR
ncbi:hypothetical protein CTAYLR_002335 [Chrysophaeum taylorii]|uniref:Uncharacterized protein n=1 Tax=Chrysophaeum taylorii TaxID=2483200 RepID=A0AAD7XJY0_9STRA|nr:hypothetical protein CTAYLR_002335 [Chrysophaeum taylorii]